MTLYHQVERAAARRLSELKGSRVFRNSRKSYTTAPDLNLVPGVTREDFWEDLDSGDGSELVDTEKAPAKFCAAHSSSALAVNSFGPFRRSPEHLFLLGSSAFGDAQFERKCPTGLRGTSPHLDFLVRGRHAIVGVESKFAEPLSWKSAGFVDSYRKLVGAESDEPWRRVYETLDSDAKTFRYLDAVQMVKHSLGLRHTFSDAPELVLLYVFWEPSNAQQHREFAAHREEISRLAEWLVGADVRFESVAYAELWDQWEEHSTWAGAAAHVSALRDRYSFEV